MLKRKIDEKLLYWKNNHKNDCLLLYGARQTGKTTSISLFAKENYESFISIDFHRYPLLKQIFSADLDPDTILERISIYLPDTKVIDGKTLILLDEIQECPEARTALKFMAQDPRVDVIATGSQLGISMKGHSIPMGYETRMRMYSLDFEEFLWALGMDDASIQSLRTYFDSSEKIPDAINTKMQEYVRLYMAVGGMPAVVDAYLENRNMSEVNDLQASLVMEYRDDIAKYAEPSVRMKAIACYDSIPNQLLKDNHKFQYKAVRKGTTSSYYEESMEWLEKAGVISRCCNTETPSFPLRGYRQNDKYIVYMNDIGLLTAMYGPQIKPLIIEDTLSGNVKGALYENLIADMMIKKDIPLYYYANEKRTVQVEFLIEENGKVVPIEVKAKNRASASLNRLLEMDDIPYGYKFISGNAGFEGKKKTLPHYMAMFL